MVSNLYKAKDFYTMQKNGKIAKNIVGDKKLKLDGNGYYLNKKRSNGDMYRLRVPSSAYVYSRSEGVSMYGNKDEGAMIEKKEKIQNKKHKRNIDNDIYLK